MSDRKGNGMSELPNKTHRALLEVWSADFEAFLHKDPARLGLNKTKKSLRLCVQQKQGKVNLMLFFCDVLIS